jgi:hypothetical protein
MDKVNETRNSKKFLAFIEYGNYIKFYASTLVTSFVFPKIITLHDKTGFNRVSEEYAASVSRIKMPRIHLPSS